MADLIFGEEQPAVWFVRDSDGHLLGSVEWHDLAGSYGFAPTAEADIADWQALSEDSSIKQILGFLRQVNGPGE